MSKDQDPQNSEYWEKRIANETWRIYNSVEKQNADLLEMYDRADKSIRVELYALMEKAESEDLTRTEAYKKAHLRELQKKIEKECEFLGDQIEKKAVARMTEAGQEVRKNVMESLGVEDFDLLPKKTMEQMLRQPWHGSFFQKRLWGDTGKLVKSLDDILVNGITQGKTATEMAVQLSNTMQKSFNTAHRLVRTETINAMNRASIRGYKDAGIKKVQWWAAEDERTCPECGKNHGATYDIGKEPNLPAHPGCRCTWIPVVSKLPQTLESGIKSAIIKPTEEYKKLEDADLYFSKKVKDFIKALSPEQEQAVRAYTGTAYEINGVLRQGLSLTRDDEEFINFLDSALNIMSLDENIILYRGFDNNLLSAYNVETIDDLMGHTLVDKGYMSTSPELVDIASDRYAYFEIKAPAGTRGAYISTLSEFSNEKEYLLPRNTKIKVIDVIDRRVIAEIVKEEGM